VRQYRATFENAAVGIAHVNPDLTYRRVNEALGRIAGYPATELVGRSMADITFPEDLDATLAQIKQVRDGETDSYDLEKRSVRKNGATVWVYVTGSAVHRSDGSIDHFANVVQDISGRKRDPDQVHLPMREMNHRAKNLLTRAGRCQPDCGA